MRRREAIILLCGVVALIQDRYGRDNLARDDTRTA
jgi:hypothetical protein